MTKRTTFSLAGPLTDSLTFRVYGNLNKTDADDADINQAHTDTASGASLAAGREGVRNKDVNALLSWALDNQQTIDFETGARGAQVLLGCRMNRQDQRAGQILSWFSGHQPKRPERL